eukprot:NODE_6271_length_641_cov_6.853041_g5339_i0.p2 GENE.NODE_6271_length_641_cov_6.853041_g5339_i0~~NODE_6271_length_641_cov_6.853041_g5339_i0.p2  ORF type:complete len:152 (-),score=46.10 NODE_6271_length_641_cov_6.853041_g5339_i0:92-547(-)
MIHFVLLISRQGKVRLAKWYAALSPKERSKAVRDVCGMVLGRQAKMCNVLEWHDQKIVWKRYASLYFVACIDSADNELIHLELIHHFVEILDRYFGNVCELDLIFNFHLAFYILDEVLINGQLQESSKKQVLKIIQNQEEMIEPATQERIE